MMSNTSLLIVDADPRRPEEFRTQLKSGAYVLHAAKSVREALATLSSTHINLLLCNADLPGNEAFELLEQVRRRFPQTVVLMFTAFGTIDGAVEAIRLGAYDYLTTPVSAEDLRLALERAAAQHALLAEHRKLKRELELRFGLESLVGHDYRMLKLFELIETVADSTVSVLIQGPSGTGKSLTARVIHRLSSRRDRPFVEVSVAAIPEALIESELFGHVRGAFTGALSSKPGKFRAADGGTIFLDEIGAASPALQVKLLRVLQERQFEPVGSNRTERVDIRVICATNADLEAEARAGRFREDLFYRINVIALELPPLCERLGDIPLLAEFFLRQHAGPRRALEGFSIEAMSALQAYPWPGNVRELANVVERCAILARGSRIEFSDLPARIVEPLGSPALRGARSARGTLREALNEAERLIIEAALSTHGGNRQSAARQLGVDRTTLYKKMRRFGIRAVGRGRRRRNPQTSAPPPRNIQEASPASASSATTSGATTSNTRTSSALTGPTR
ncbi:MAG: Transcriptional regulatory protein ZraR [Phycisphaerae bacterium]|nr:Transcriptional regulatory protein ZraR [Phycisphaerae bacterium]